MRYLLILAAISMLLTGCPKSTTTQPPLAPGYSNLTDQTLGETLAAADTFYKRIQASVAAGTMTLSAGEKITMNDLALALNIANATYLSYHNGQATLAQAQAAINTVSQKQQAAESLMNVQGVK